MINDEMMNNKRQLQEVLRSTEMSSMHHKASTGLSN